MATGAGGFRRAGAVGVAPALARAFGLAAVLAFALAGLLGFVAAFGLACDRDGLEAALSAAAGGWAAAEPCDAAGDFAALRAEGAAEDREPAGGAEPRASVAAAFAGETFASAEPALWPPAAGAPPSEGRARLEAGVAGRARPGAGSSASDAEVGRAANCAGTGGLRKARK